MFLRFLSYGFLTSLLILSSSPNSYAFQINCRENPAGSPFATRQVTIFSDHFGDDYELCREIEEAVRAMCWDDFSLHCREGNVVVVPTNQLFNYNRYQLPSNQCIGDIADSSGAPGGDGATEFGDLLLMLTEIDQTNGTPTYPELTDLNGNGIVGFDDLLIVQTDWDCSELECPNTSEGGIIDFDHNGIINIADFQVVLDGYGKKREPSAPPLEGDTNLDDKIDFEDLLYVASNFGPCT